MKLTIDISDDLFNGIVENKYGIYNGKFFDMIRGGTQVSEGYGELKDTSELQIIFHNLCNAYGIDNISFISEMDMNFDLASTINEK